MEIDFFNIGKRLQETRIQSKITQEQMAEKLGIPKDSIEKIENGIVNLELRRFIEICEFLNISVYDVLNNKKENIIRYMDKDLYELIVRCNIEKQKLIYNMVKLLIKNRVV